jgi:type IV pilus assembly protein PilM
MARVERILAIDIGATSIKVGEFEYPARETVTLVGFAHREYEEELTESSRSVVVAGLLRQMLVENSFQARRALISISGQAAFTRFVKLPPFAEDEKRIRQIVEFEAKQNVPFPMDEVIWDYQLIANPDAEEMDVMFVVIKNEIVEQMTGAVQAVGLEPVLVDVAPAACYNAARANRLGDEECCMILNIGGRSTNLLFADRNRFFARTIPIAGHSITQQVGKEFGIGFAEAEELKRRHGFVALGGAYAEPESEVAAAVSKIIRNVMARLHGEINRSISVYRAQQRGNRPTRLYLTGGSSTMTYCDHFFSEKLRMEVNYFNPFQVVSIGPAVDRQALEAIAHMFSEVIGLGLRYKVPCPIEVSLVPETIRREQAIRRKKPYLCAAVACIVVILLVAWNGSMYRTRLYASAVEKVERHRFKFEPLVRQIKDARSEADQKVSQYRSVEELLLQRRTWPALLNKIYELKPDNIWFYSVQAVVGEMKLEAAGGGEGGMFGGGGDMFPGGGDMFPAGGAEMFPGGEGDMGMGMGMEGGMGDTAVSGSYVKISGLELSGHSVILDADTVDGAGAATTPAGPPADGEAVPPPAEAPPAERAGDEAAPPEEGPEGEENAPQTPAPEGRQGTPELAFLAALKAADFVDPDESFTRIKSYDASQDIRNLGSFVIQVKFKEPLEFYQVGATGR